MDLDKMFSSAESLKMIAKNCCNDDNIWQTVAELLDWLPENARSWLILELNKYPELDQFYDMLITRYSDYE